MNMNSILFIPRDCEETKYVTLDQIAEISTGSSNTNENIENGIYPFFVRSQEPLRKNDYEYDETAIITAGDGVGVGKVFHFVEGKYALHQRAYRIHVTSKDVNPKYLFHYMKAKFYSYIQKTMFQGSVASIRRPMLNSFPVPVPPIEVQREIVRVLDNLTELTGKLTAELTAELEARKKQYAEYLNLLINEDCLENANTMKLGQLFEFRNGLSKGKEYFGKGIPFIRYTDVYNNRSIRKENISALVDCTETELKNLQIRRGDVLFTRTSETAEDVGWSSVMLDEIDACVFNGFTIRATPLTDFLLPEYCKYCFSTNRFRKFVTSKCTFTTRASLTGKTLSEYEMAVPSLEDQQRIVSILDKLYDFCQRLGEKLSTEIEARQKQYEHYRDKLLTFEEKP